METVSTTFLFVFLNPSSDPTYEAWKLQRMMILRMPGLMVPILPMRHGHLDVANMLYENGFSSDPTYEAWKLSTANPISAKTIKSSDPTYEAWKR